MTEKKEPHEQKTLLAGNKNLPDVETNEGTKKVNKVFRFA